ncbi:unnamed protein product [Peronospora farinosa]|uniref:Uncharacterized protein n=1 Tax=Peronospora farinosa TaxID=134698 RepID=A0AAV0UBL8_9STRA|nr:unnamed protein product [Peronospora farinosa]
MISIKKSLIVSAVAVALITTTGERCALPPPTLVGPTTGATLVGHYPTRTKLPGWEQVAANAGGAKNGGNAGGALSNPDNAGGALSNPDKAANKAGWEQVAANAGGAKNGGNAGGALSNPDSAANKAGWKQVAANAGGAHYGGHNGREAGGNTRGNAPATSPGNTNSGNVNKKYNGATSNIDFTAVQGEINPGTVVPQ